jgi:hypothetical protein
MKNRFTIPALLILPMLVATTACRKKGDDTNKSKTELLTQHSWRHEAYGTDDNNDGTIDTPVAMDACRNDDLISFATNGSGTFNQGSDLCFPASPVVQDFTWEFTNNESKLVYAGGTNTIISLTDHKMVLAVDESSVRYIVVFKH